MGYRGGGMPIARFQTGGFTDAQVAQYFAENPGLNESQIAEAMRGTGVSPEQVARVTGADPGYVSQRYDQYLDLVDQRTVRPVSGPPSPAVSPVVSNPVSLTPAGIAALAPSANVSLPANVFSPADYGPPSPPPAAPPTASPAEIQRMQAQRAEAELLRLREAERPIVDPRPQPTVDPVAQNLLDRFNAFMGAGDFAGAANILKEGEGVYGGEVYNVASNYLNTDPRFAGLREQIGIGQKDTPAFNANNLRSFVDSQLATQATPVTPEGAAAPPTAQTTPGPGQIYGIPRFERQTQSNVPFAPLRRGLAQLRPAMYMPGLTSGQAPLGGSGFTPESLRNAIQSMTAAGQTPADVAYQMDVGGVSPAELSAAIGTPVGQIQAQYNQSRPRGLFSTGVPTFRGLPEDFTLQTGAYGAPTPTFLALPGKNTATSAAETPFPSGSIQGTDYTQNPIIGYTDVGTPIYAPTAPESTAKEGGLIKMAEGGEPPPMSRLSAKEAGSTFDISKYIDDQGRLVGGYSKPIYDENRVITGYEYRPYERDVVFGEELREKEAAMRLTDAERKQMMVEMAMRQGRTGIDPRAGGLAGIEIGDPMMRRRPQYYSTVEQFRPRYAKGGIASIAEELASKGRGGDSMLVHMAPHEVAGLNAIARMQGTELTINPETGMPEALKLGKLFKMLAPMALGFALGPAGAGIFSSALNAGLAVGAGYTLATGSLQQGISAGLGAYGGANLGTGLQAAGTADAVGQAAASEAAGTGLQVAGAAGGDAASAALVESQLGYGDIPFESFNQAPASYSYAVPPPSPTSISLTGGAGSGLSLTPEATGFAGAGPTIPGGEELFTQQIPIDSVNLATGARETAMSTVPKTSSVLTSDVTGLGSTPTPGSALTGAERYFGDKATSDLAAERYADATGSTLGTSAMQIAGGAAGQSAADAERAMRAQQAAIVAKQDERKRRFDALFGRTVGTLPARSGGLMKLAGGGMTYMEAGGTTGPTGTPRDVTGTGDGMSDSVPASIEGVQEARLADGEFVIPADVVADIGNGSSDAGSKKLYDMMDRIRKARHGTTEQPPEIQAERLMPA